MDLQIPFSSLTCGRCDYRPRAWSLRPKARSKVPQRSDLLRCSSSLLNTQHFADATLTAGTSDRFLESDLTEEDKENNGVNTPPANRRATLCAGISSSALHNEASTPSSAKKKAQNVDVNRLRDENKVLRISLKEESRLR